MLVLIILIAAAGVSAGSYYFSSIAAAQILNMAAEDARSNSKTQAKDLSAILANKVESAAKNLEVMADARSIQLQEIDRAIPLFAAAQKSTANITTAYAWLDEDGKVLWSTEFSNATLREQYAGADFSYREYYTQPRESLGTFYSTATESVADGRPRLTVSHPVIERQFIIQETAGIFKGVVVASIEVETLGGFIEAQLAQGYDSSVGLMDRNGYILYSSSSPEYVGKNVFDSEYQSRLPTDIKDSFNQFLQESLKGNTGSGDFALQGRTGTIAYNPVNIDGNEFALMYVVTPHELAASTLAFVEQQRMWNYATIIAIAGVAAGVAAVVMTWNRRLSDIAAAKTVELNFANESILESNMQLQESNKKLEELNRQLAAANEELTVHDRLQREFVNVAAHELRTPIQPLLGAAEIIESQFSDRDKISITKPEVEMILRNAKRLERLSSDILEISRIDSGALRLNKEDFSLAYIIAEAVRDAKAQSIYDPDKLSITYCPDDIFVHADKDKITQVITNLLTNAIKFTEQGEISVSTQRAGDGGFVLVEVRDTGTGIDPEVLPRLFGKFVTKSEKGTGIGLYISKKIVEAHGGTIFGGNNPEGAGATFKFTLPLEQEREGGMQASDRHFQVR